MENKKNKRIIATYLILVFGISSFLYFIISANGGLDGNGELYVIPLMWAPAISAMIALLINKEKLSSIGWGGAKPKFFLTGYLAPIIYAGLAYSVIWLLGLGILDTGIFGSSPTAGIIKPITTGLAGSMVLALGEEIGWRGLLVPRLATYMSLRKTAMLSGFIWGVWHVPLIISGGYSSGAPAWFAVLCFMVLVIGMSFLFAWLRLQSGSIWPTVLLHATHNSFIQSVLDKITVDNGTTEYFTTEFGLGLALMGVVMVLIISTIGKRTSTPNMMKNTGN